MEVYGRRREVKRRGVGYERGMEDNRMEGVERDREGGKG